MLTKICTKCFAEKPSSEFYKHSQKKDGLNPRCKVCQRADAKASYEKNPEPAKERAKKWSLDNPDRAKARSQEYYTKTSYDAKRRAKAWAAANPERRKQIASDSAEKHADKKRKKNREYILNWKARDPEGYAIENRRWASIRRSRLQDAGVNISKEEWRAIITVFAHTCVYCGATTRNLTMDHWVPVALGGKTEPGNLIPCCKPCNSSKGAMHPSAWKEKAGISDVRKEGSCTIEQFLEISREALRECSI